jgi:polysaccharide biosynthesis protein PslH
MKILFLTTVLPRKKRMGSEVASQSLIDAFSTLGNDVTVAGYVRTDDCYEVGSQEVCVGRRPIESKSAGLYPLLWFARSLLRGLPYSMAKYWSRAFTVFVSSQLRQGHYDLIVIDHVQMIWLADHIPNQNKLIGLAHNIEHQMYGSFIGEKKKGWRRWVYERESRLLQKQEIGFANRVDQLWALTKSDANFFSGIKKNGSVKEIPLPPSTMPSDEKLGSKDFDIGLIGSWTWKANEEGLAWFFNRVYPQLPHNLDIRVAGSGASWLEGRFANVKYLGFVDDAQDFLRHARAVAIPTLSGGGIQIKTLDAIASGSKIVATPLAMRGIDDRPATVAVAETPDQFATLLASAIAASGGDSFAIDAIQWSRLRLQRFQNEIMESIQQVTHSRGPN